MLRPFYERPEVCNTEYFASDLLAKQLRQEGFEVTQNIAGHETGFVGVYRASKPGPVLAFLAEYDALPGIGHACGHNLFGNYSLLAAVATQSRHRWPRWWDPSIRNTWRRRWRERLCQRFLCQGRFLPGCRCRPLCSPRPQIRADLTALG